MLTPPLISRDCPICGPNGRPEEWMTAVFDGSKINGLSFASRKTPEGMTFRMMRCLTCDLLFADPSPSEEWFRRGYGDALYDSGEEARYAAGAYSRSMDRFLPSLPDKDTALDIGAGNGAFLERLLDMGFAHTSGVEPSLAAINDATEAIKPLVRHGFFRAADYAPDSFSLVTCFQTVEHVFNPMTLCGEAMTILKKGGAFCLVGHNYRSISARLLGRRSPIYDIEHLQLNSPKSIAAMLGRAGFTRVAVIPIINKYPLRYWLKLAPLPASVKRAAGRLTDIMNVSSLGVPIAAGNMMAIGFKH